MDDLENKHSPYNDAKWNADANTKKRKKVALAILRGLASREQRDANPRGMTQRKKKKKKNASAIPRGWASRQQRDANPRRMTQHLKQENKLILGNDVDDDYDDDDDDSGR